MEEVRGGEWRRKESFRDPHERCWLLVVSAFAQQSAQQGTAFTVRGTGSPVIQSFMPVPAEFTSADLPSAVAFPPPPFSFPFSGQPAKLAKRQRRKVVRRERKRNGNSSTRRRARVSRTASPESIFLPFFFFVSCWDYAVPRSFRLFFKAFYRKRAFLSSSWNSFCNQCEYFCFFFFYA